MRIWHDKLVRDRIPEIIAEHGRACETRVLGKAEYEAALRAKLVEEAREAQAASPKELAKELGDILEVAAALEEAAGIKHEEVEALRSRRRRERGSFAGRIFLVWADADE